MNASFWLAAAAGCVAIAALGGILLGRGKRPLGERVETSEPGAGVHTFNILDRVLAIGLLIAPTAVAAWQVARVGLPGAGDAALAVLLLETLLILGVTWIAFRSSRVVPYLMPSGGLRRPRRRDRVAAAATAVFGVVSLAAAPAYLLLVSMLRPGTPVALVVGGLLLAAAIASTAVRRNVSRIEEGKLTELGAADELRLEVVAVAQAFGWRPNRVYIYPIQALPAGKTRPTRAGDIADLLVGLDRWRNGFHPMKPTLPEELVRAVPVPAVSAGVAMRYANAALLNPMRWSVGRLPSSLLGLLGIAVLGLIMYFAARRLGEEPLAAAAFGCWSAAVLALIAGALVIRHRGRRFHQSAYEAWKRASSKPDSGSAERSVEDFVAALATLDQAMKRASDSRAILSRLRKDARLQRFLEERAPGAFERSLQRVGESLAPPAPADGDKKPVT